MGATFSTVFDCNLFPKTHWSSISFMKRFLPDVSRNRLLTNWVRARRDAGEFQRDLPASRWSHTFNRRLYIFLGVGLVSAIMFGALFQISNDSVLSHRTALEPQALITPSSLESPAPKVCTEQHLAGVLAETTPSHDSPSNVAGYEIKGNLDLGGVLVSDYACVDSHRVETFRVQWLLRTSVWKIEKISRPPVRQSGDFK